MLDTILAAHTLCQRLPPTLISANTCCCPRCPLFPRYKIVAKYSLLRCRQSLCPSSSLPILLFNNRDRQSLAKLVADARFLSLLIVCHRHLGPTTLQPIVAVSDADTRCRSSRPIFAADTLRPRSKTIHAVYALQPLSQPVILASDILRPCSAPRFVTHTAHCPRFD